MFAARWPHFARIEASVLFIFAVLAASRVPVVWSIAVATAATVHTAPPGWSPGVPGWAVLALLTAMPFSVTLLAVGGLLRVRKGYAILSILAVGCWAGAVFLLWHDPALRPFKNLSPGAAASLAAATALVIHVRPFTIGLRDRGFVALRLTAGRDEALAWRRPESRPLGRTARAQPWVAPNPRGRATGPARSAIAVRRALPWGLIFALTYNACIYRSQIADRINDLVARWSVAGRDFAQAGIARHARGSDEQPVLDAQANGAGIQVVYDPQASLLTLTSETAERLGLSRKTEDFSTFTKTTYGFIQVASVTIDNLRIGSTTLTHVAAYIAEPGRLPQSVVGRSLLQRLAPDRVLTRR